MNESMIAQQQANGNFASPDKQAKASAPNLIVMADLEQIDVKENSADKSNQPIILYEDGDVRKDTPPFDSYRSIPSQDQEEEQKEQTEKTPIAVIEEKPVVEVEHVTVNVEVLEKKEELEVETVA